MLFEKSKKLGLILNEKQISLFLSIFCFILIFNILGCISNSVKLKSSSPVSKIPIKYKNPLPQEFSKLKKINVDYQLMGYCKANVNNKYKKSSQEIEPKKIDKNFTRAGTYLVINQDETTVFQNEMLGQKLYLVNNSSDEINAWIFDGRFLIDAEALNENNEWAPISYIPEIVSGNNINWIKLKKNRFLEFSVPVFEGNFKTKLRYSFRDNWTGKKIVSNEIEANINKLQLDKNKKEGRKNIDSKFPITEIPNRNIVLLKSKVLQLDKLNIDETLVGLCFANTKPLKIDEDFPQGSLYLVANQKEYSIAHINNLGFYLYLVNATPEKVNLDTIDHCLHIIMEVLNENNEWTSISTLPWSWCGNSYFPIQLKSNEYLKFNVPIFNGSYKTKLRFVLRVNEDQEICSNEIETAINFSQLKHEKFLNFNANKKVPNTIDIDQFMMQLKK